MMMPISARTAASRCRRWQSTKFSTGQHIHFLFLGRHASSSPGLDSVDIVGPQQASPLGLAHAARILDEPDAKIIKIFETHGTQVAASLPTALHDAVMAGRDVAGQRRLMMGTAAGLSIGGMMIDL